MPRDHTTLVPPREGACPEHETEQLRIYAILHRQELADCLRTD
jgi:hypothetical protein